jgi:hypothetical protein
MSTEFLVVETYSKLQHNGTSILLFYDTNNGKLKEILECKDGVAHLNISPKGDLIAVGNTAGLVNIYYGAKFIQGRRLSEAVTINVSMAGKGA